MKHGLRFLQDFPFEFYGERYVAHLADDRQFYVRLNDICNGMGLSPSAQLRRIQENKAITDYLVIALADTLYQRGYRRQEVTFLDIRALPYWLGTIDAKRVKAEIHEKFVRFQRCFAETTWKVYRSDLMPAEVLAEMNAYEVPARAEIDGTMDSLRNLTNKMDKLEGRMGVIEAHMGAEAIINTSHRSQIKANIERVGDALFEQDGNKLSKAECYDAVHSKFNAHFQIPVYSLLPESKRKEAVLYLFERFVDLQPGKDVPEDLADGIQTSRL